MALQKDDKVRVRVAGGSVGIVEGIREDGPFASDPGIYVRFHYGLDVKGRPMTAMSGYMRERELEKIDDATFDAVAKRNGFGDGPVANKRHASLVESSRRLLADHDEMLSLLREASEALEPFVKKGHPDEEDYVQARNVLAKIAKMLTS